MANFIELADKLPEGTLKKIYTIVADRQRDNGMTTDSVQVIRHTRDDLDKIKEALYSEVQTGMIEDGGYQSLDDLRQGILKRTAQIVTDSFFNPVTGIGTKADPGWYNTAMTPISMTPNEVTAYYSSGGIPRIVIDKKSEGIFTNGYSFVGDEWEEEETDQLLKYADSLGFDKETMESIRDGLLYGGSIEVPALKGETALTYGMTIAELGARGYLKKGCIDYLWHADRWNAVLVPDYNLSAKNYLHPDEMYVPLAGVAIKTERAALLRPKTLPYWGTIRQIGWGISDMEGWIKSVLAYVISIESIPIMSQQLSLMFRTFPLEGLLAQNGPDAAQEFAKAAAKQLVEASNINPKTLTTIGDIKVIERHFTGFSELIQILRQDIGAQSELAESILFHTQPTGFSDNKEDTTLKEAGTIKKLGNTLVPQLKPLVKMLVYGCFGWGSPQAEKAHLLRISFDSPTVLTTEQRVNSLTAFSSWFTAGTNAGLSARDTILVGKSMLPDLEIPQEVIDGLDMGDENEQENVSGSGVDDLMNRMRGEKAAGDLLAQRMKPQELVAQKKHATGIQWLLNKLQGNLQTTDSRK